MQTLSTELFAIPLECGRYLINAPERSIAFVGNTAMINFLADLRDGKNCSANDLERSQIELLQSTGLLRTSSESSSADRSTDVSNTGPMSLTLAMDGESGCVYCDQYSHATAIPDTVGLMDLWTAKHHIETFTKKAKQSNAPIAFINFQVCAFHDHVRDMISQSVAYARELSRTLKLDVCVSYRGSEIVSLANTEWLHKTMDYAVFEIGKLSSLIKKGRVKDQCLVDDWRCSLRALDGAAFPYRLLLLISADEIQCLSNFVDVTLSHHKPAEMQIEPAFPLNGWDGNPSRETLDFIEAFRAAMRATSDGQCELFMSGTRLDELRNFCGLTPGDHVVQSNGSISTCCETEESTTPIQDNDCDKMVATRRKEIAARPYCKECYAKWNCAGSCYRDTAVEFTGSNRCHIVRELTKDRILAKIASAGGMIWADNPEGIAHWPTTIP